jgi:hypothetical protein
MIICCGTSTTDSFMRASSLQIFIIDRLDHAKSASLQID